MSHLTKVRMLYKTILKLHRGLPSELKALGDEYTKEEFKRHKTCSEMEAQVFIGEWAGYAINLAQQLGIKGKPSGKIGSPLSETAVDDLRDEQVAQLYELLKAAHGIEPESGKKDDGT